jgi:hypothetical protein
MSLFTNQIKTLIETMSQVKEVESFKMSTWYTDHSTTYSKCGFAACICGHQALALPSEFFSFTFVDITQETSLINRAELISSDLNKSCYTETDEEYLALAIYDGDDEERKSAAWKCCKFDELELEHPHLTSESSPEHAISFMELVLTKLENV